MFLQNITFVLLANLLGLSVSLIFKSPTKKYSRFSSPSSLSAGQTLYDKIYTSHLIPSSTSTSTSSDDPLIYIDRHLIHEVTSPQAFEGLRLASRSVRRPDSTLATVDHNVPTSDRSELKSVETFIEETQVG